MDCKRWPLLALLALTGCQSQVPTQNPFFATTVPPPSTAGTAEAPAFGAGSMPGVTSGTPAPTATLGAPAGSTFPPAVTAPTSNYPGTSLPAGVAPPPAGATSAPAQSTPYYPPGGTFDFRTGSIERAIGESLAAASEPIPESASYDRSTTDGAKRPSRAIVASTQTSETQSALSQPTDLARGERIDRLDWAADGVGAATELATIDGRASESPIRIPAAARTELRIVESSEPERVASTSGWTTGRRRGDEPAQLAVNDAQTRRLDRVSEPAPTDDHRPSRVTLASHQTPARSPSASTGGEYRHDEQYQTLYGKLEYSQASDQWKLRYIPIDGQTDRYGGSVVIDNVAAVEGHRPGAYIIAEGAITSDKANGARYSPKFAVRKARAQ